MLVLVIYEFLVNSASLEEEQLDSTKSAQVLLAFTKKFAHTSDYYKTIFQKIAKLI